MARVGKLLSKKFIKNALIVLAIVAVAYVVMYGVKEGFQAGNTLTTVLTYNGAAGAYPVNPEYKNMTGKKVTGMEVHVLGACLTAFPGKTVDANTYYKVQPLRYASNMIRMEDQTGKYVDYNSTRKINPTLSDKNGLQLKGLQGTQVLTTTVGAIKPGACSANVDGGNIKVVMQLS